ncbi:MAG: hypothetical protein ABIA63_01180, partial [bacterium]
PAVFRVDEEMTVIYKNFINGNTIRDLIVGCGGRILNVQVAKDIELNKYSGHLRIEAVWKRAQNYFNTALPKYFVDELEKAIDKIHSLGITGLSITYGNIMLEKSTGNPVFIDFEGARGHKFKNSYSFFLRRDQDREKFNKIYGKKLLTYNGIKNLFKDDKFIDGTRYAPIDLGWGFATRGFWSVGTGTGRWDFFNRKVLGDMVKNKRILDLGSNNGLMPLMMLRDGAREVIGIEKSFDLAKQSIILKRLFEWKDMKQYNLKIISGDMLDILKKEWGNFELITAFCSLYYLNSEDMARLVRKLSEMAPILVIQAKTDTRNLATEGKTEKSSVNFLKKIISENGFGNVDIFTQHGFTRPILIGKK